MTPIKALIALLLVALMFFLEMSRQQIRAGKPGRVALRTAWSRMPASWWRILIAWAMISLIAITA